MSLQNVLDNAKYYWAMKIITIICLVKITQKYE